MGPDDWTSKVGDGRRLGALLASRLLDSGPEEAFDRLTKLCAELLGSPVAMVSLVDERRQFWKSSELPDGPGHLVI